MAHGDGGIAEILHHHQGSHRFAHDVGASQHNAVLAGSGNVVAAQEFDNSFGRCGEVARQADVHSSYIHGVETVHVLAIIDGFNYLLLRDVRRQGQLHNKAIDVFIFIKSIDAGQQFLFRHIVLETDKRAFKTTGFAGQHFVAHVSFASAVVSNKYGGEVRAFHTLRHHFGNFCGNFLLNRCSRSLSVNNCHPIYIILYGYSFLKVMIS